MCRNRRLATRCMQAMLDSLSLTSCDPYWRCQSRPMRFSDQFFPSSHTVRSEASGTTIIAPGKPAAQHSAHPLEQPTALSPMPCIMTTIFFGRVVLPK
eukprot:CAMPEP_0115708216 /NCGR_PEP_ID=MMETSP0272-20121206/71795_1 /TAXON_ID=71861 /ORGANISM="Scrippsiella trochoidea, Strain CCMP3099" /LENGTH=97 /DNA_ID=CAMNT_0003149695 /DNA_START=516 /DNA_END=809 /DNA_ORIENTATION=+